MVSSSTPPPNRTTPAASAPPPAAAADDMSSLLIAALPASIQSRIPKISAIRRTVSMQSLFFRAEMTATATVASSDAPLSSDLSSCPSSSSASSPAPSSSSSFCSSPPSSRPSTSAGPCSRRGSARDGRDGGLVLAATAQRSLSEPSASDVNWKFAQNGFRNLQNALREAGDPDRLPALERQIYVESVAYLLRGLPADLQDGELSQLRSAAPEGLLGVPPALAYPAASPLSPEQHLALQQHGLGIYSYSGGPLPSGCGPSSAAAGGAASRRAALYRKTRSLPHIATHWLVTKLYALVLLLIPVAVSLARWALEMERKYHVPEAVLGFATTVFLLLYRNAAGLYVAVCNMGDGSVGRAFDDGTAYLANGVASGFREAVLDVARGQR